MMDWVKLSKIHCFNENSKMLIYDINSYKRSYENISIDEINYVCTYFDIIERDPSFMFSLDYRLENNTNFNNLLAQIHGKELISILKKEDEYGLWYYAFYKIS